jgi:replicative DNA helicase
LNSFQLVDEFNDLETERGVIAAIAARPDLYWELLDFLPAGVFSAEQAAWQNLSQVIETEQPVLSSLSALAEWTAAADPKAAAQRLADLYQRRLLAGLQENLAAALYSARPAPELLGLLDEEVARVQSAVRETHSGKLLWAGDLIGPVLAEAENRQLRRQQTGSAILGVATGLSRLDELLNGLGTGLYILAGAPGSGKTTLSLQIAQQAAAHGTPVIYVTYENSPSNLVLKALCARARMPASQVERGFGNPQALRWAALELQPVFEKLAIIEGNSKLTVGQVRGKALQALARHKAGRCLVIFDYLQRAAHNAGYDQLRYNVSAMAGELRDLANRLNSPVLAISSQNRAGGDYGKGGGSATLDSLKESGDLEYSADAVMFLRLSDKRQVPPPARAVDLVLAKNRFGDTGLVPLVFRPDLGDLREEVPR